jgi:two-component system sensor histidine kinase KdpD
MAGTSANIRWNFRIRAKLKSMRKTSAPGSARIAQLALRVAAMGAIVGALTYTMARVVPVNATTAGFGYLVAILFGATKWGLTEATIGSVVAVLCFNYFFLPPVGTFTISDPQNWVALFALLITSITASRLSTRVRRQAVEAQDRQQELERLYSLSRSILLIDSTQSVARQVVNQVAQAFEAAAVILYDLSTGEMFRGGKEDFSGTEEQLRQAASQGTQIHEPGARTWITAVRLGAQPVGSLGISGVVLSDSAVQSLTNLVAIGLERARAQESASRAEAARQSDELKSTLLDAIAHEFKTPLTTIKASTTALLSDRPPKPEQQREYISLVDEEADRLSGLVSEAIQMARIEAGQVRLQLEETPVAELLENVLAKMKSIVDDRKVEIRTPADLPPVLVDREMMEMTFRQLIDNAVKYSPPGSPITITADAEDGQVVTRVQDRGSGIATADLPRIFQKFYRAKEFRNQVPGAGLGLAIARAVVTAHGGTIWAESKPGAGSSFCVALSEAPSAAEGNT